MPKYRSREYQCLLRGKVVILNSFSYANMDSVGGWVRVLDVIRAGISVGRFYRMGTYLLSLPHTRVLLWPRGLLINLLECGKSGCAQPDETTNAKTTHTTSKKEPIPLGCEHDDPKKKISS